MRTRSFYPLYVLDFTLLDFLFAGLLAKQALIPLGGEWRFAMDRDDMGVKQQWLMRDLGDRTLSACGNSQFRTG